MKRMITIDVSSYPPKGMGEKQYESHPRIGEWVEIEVDGQGTMFLVVMIAHSSTGAGSDVYVKLLSETSLAIQGLCGR